MFKPYYNITAWKLVLDSVVLNNNFLVAFQSLCILLVQDFAGISLEYSGLLVECPECPPHILRWDRQDSSYEDAQTSQNNQGQC